MPARFSLFVILLEKFCDSIKQLLLDLFQLALDLAACGSDMSAAAELLAELGSVELVCGSDGYLIVVGMSFLDGYADIDALDSKRDRCQPVKLRLVDAALCHKLLGEHYH